MGRGEGGVHVSIKNKVVSFLKQNIIYKTFLLQPEKFVNLGIEPPKGVLLFGPPGTGKTLCARAVANRTDACFIRVIGSELVQKYVGEVRVYNYSHSFFLSM